MGRNKCLYALIIIGLFFVFGCKGEEKQAEITGVLSEVTPAGNATVSLQTNATVLPSGQDLAAQGASAVVSQGKAASDKDIQQALKNAGFYQGEIDGKFGPKTKKAIEDFQAKNNLKADGKVGPLTWGKLGVYLNADASKLQADAPEVPQEIKD